MNKKENVSVRLPSEVLRAYEKKAREEMRSLSSLCGFALIKYYEKELKNQEQEKCQ